MTTDRPMGIEVTQALEPCPFSGKTPTGPIKQNGGSWRIYGAGYFFERPTEALARDAWNTRQSSIASLTGDVGMREAALVDAVRGALECLGKPDGYLPDIGAPKTRALQRAFEAYEPHPTFKGY